MKLCTLVEILLPLFVLLVVSQHAKGFSTKKCNDARLKDQLKKQVRCLDPLLNEYVKEVLKVYKEQNSKKTKIFDLAKACKTHNKLWKKVTKCNNELATKCLGSKMVQLSNAVHSLLELRCNSPDKVGVVDANKLINFPRLAEQIIGSDATSYFEALVQFDKTCNTIEMGDELRHINVPCFNGIVQAFIRPIGMYFHDKNMAFPEYISPCKSIISSLKSCLDENACFSQNEMALVREAASTVYQWEMDASVQIIDSFGSVANANEALRATTVKYKTEQIPLSKVLYFEAGQPWFDDLMAKILKTVDFVIKDFKNKKCKRNLKGIPKLS
jgi:hypothetical protein